MTYLWRMSERLIMTFFNQVPKRLAIYYIETRDCRGGTPLINSCLEGDVKFTDILLKHGADINAQDADGTTALMHAAITDNVMCFQLLLKEGADLDIVDYNGSTAFSYAVRGEGDVLDFLLKSGTVLCDGALKSEHKAGLVKAMSQERYFSFNFNTLLLLIDYNISYWDWCGRSTVDQLDTFIIPAIRSSISPGLFNYKGFEMSMLPKAFDNGAAPSNIKFLLAHRYFYPEDYAVISTNTSFQKDLQFLNIVHIDLDETLKIFKQLTLHPLSLQTWSFLTISKAVSLAGPLTGRTDRVNALHLPEQMKRALRFQTDITELCPYEWEQLTIDQVFDSLNFRKEIFWEGNLKCDNENCLECDGDYSNWYQHVLECA